MDENVKKNKGLMIAGAVSAVIAIIGIVFWIIQLNGGLIQTGMRNLDSWGLYITCFMFFVGLSAGGLIISSIPNAFGMEGFGGISKVAIWTSICSTIAAVGFVVVDLGQPMRLWELFLYSNLGSPLMWDIIAISIYLILSIVYLWAYMRHEAGKVSVKALRVMSVVALVAAVAVHTVTAWIFGLQQAHGFWHTALLGPWFVSSALVCGTALVMIVVIGLRKMGYLQVEQKNLIKMAKMLAVFLIVDLYFFACDLITSAFPGGSGLEVVEILVSGPLAPFFWLEIIASVLAIIALTTPRLRTNPILIGSAVLSIVAIFCKRVQLLVGGFQIANIDFVSIVDQYAITNWENGIAQAYSGMVYWPTGIEWIVTLGVIGLASAVLFFGLAKLNLKPLEK